MNSVTVKNRRRADSSLSIRDAIRTDIGLAPGGRDKAAEIIGVANSNTVSAYTCDTKRKTHTMSLNQFEELLDWSGGQFAAAAIAQRCGGIFVPVDVSSVQDVNLLGQIRDLTVSLGRMVDEVTDAVEDDEVDSREKKRIAAAHRHLIEQVNKLAAMTALLERDT